jgi:aspartyl-tRNA(Asn)/glutamyl-tRNA(Gln) amidotransferase subunit A
MPWMMSAGAISDAYRRRALSPVAAVRSVWQRMEAVNRDINAVISCSHEQVSDAARRSEQRWNRGQQLSALDGIPFTVKDNIAAAGLHTTSGSRLYADHMPQQDELPVARLRAAGAILIGKTNLPELALHGYTNNALFGVTRNPWDLRLTPGGSSGGAVAAVAAGIAPLAIATDGGGSIRRPCSHTGCVGLKPSLGRVPRSHGLPNFLQDFEVIGPIARSVSDLILVMQTITLPDGSDARSGRFHNRPFSVPEVSSPARMLLMSSLGDAPVDPEIRASVESAARGFEHLGHVLMPGKPREVALLEQAIDAVNTNTWPVISQAGLASMIDRDFPGREGDLMPMVAQMVAAGRALTYVDRRRAQEHIKNLQHALTVIFETVDCLLMPSAAALPWDAAASHPDRIDGVPVGPRGHAVFTAFVNAAGLPAIALPGPPAGNGLPIGFQLVGPHGSDGWLCALACQYEQAAPWPTSW